MKCLQTVTLQIAIWLKRLFVSQMQRSQEDGSSSSNNEDGDDSYLNVVSMNDDQADTATNIVIVD